MSSSAQPAQPAQPRTKTGCQNCRLRHLKCDENRPSCSRCEKAGIDCIRGYNIRFKHGANPSISNSNGSSKTDFDFSESQPWVNTARNLTFLDETQELINIYDKDGDDNTYTVATQAAQQWRTPPDATMTDAGSTTSAVADLRERDASEQMSYVSPANHVSPTNVSAHSNPSPRYNVNHGSFSELNSPAKRRRLTFSNSYHGTPFHGTPGSTSGPSPENDISNSNGSPATSWHAPSYTELTAALTDPKPPDLSGLDAAFAELHPSLSNHDDTSTSAPSFLALSSSLSRIYLEVPIWPLSNKEEARLLRYYTENLARNFDLTDPLCHFRKVVPQRAATCPTLLNAIFALSARHLSRVEEYDPLISNRYHQECLKHLIPMLDDTEAILDENLLASTIILRHLEEIEIPVSGQNVHDQTSHLLGAHAFITAQERATVTGGLRLAAFWTGLRQEIYVAFVNQRSILPALEHCNLDRSFNDTDDYTWACRSVVLSADVIRYCFGTDTQSTPFYNFLTEAVDKWYVAKPLSYQPIYFADVDEDRIFPEIMYAEDHLVTGLQHYHLSRILLSAHNPQIPRLGPKRAAALRAADEEIKHHVRVLCGLALSNPFTPPNFVYACMGATMCGDKFEDRATQEGLLEILNTCDAVHAWPTGVAQSVLKEAWGWAQT